MDYISQLKQEQKKREEYEQARKAEQIKYRNELRCSYPNMFIECAIIIIKKEIKDCMSGLSDPHFCDRQFRYVYLPDDYNDGYKWVNKIYPVKNPEELEEGFALLSEFLEYGDYSYSTAGKIEGIITEFGYNQEEIYSMLEKRIKELGVNIERLTFGYYPFYKEKITQGFFRTHKETIFIGNRFKFDFRLSW